LIYKAFFENSSKNIIDYENKKIILLISVGQLYHEGGKLSATIELINKSKFDSCSIVVADSLQKHNLIDDHSPYETSMSLGDNWLKRNKSILNELTISNQITRWDYWLKHCKYSSYRAMLQTAYNSNPAYKKAVDETIYQFIQRYIKRNPNTDSTIKDVLFNSCLQYLLEECAIIICLWADEGYNFIIYPKPITSALSMTYEIFVKNKYEGNLVEWLSLIFKK
jgi:hypothetical protein